MAMTLLDSGPKLDWTRDNQIFLRYKKWRAKVELIFRSALSQATPEERTSYLKYWMGDQGLPLIEKWETTGKLDYSNANTSPAKEGGRTRPLSSGFKLETYWKLLEEEFKPKDSFRRSRTSQYKRSTMSHMTAEARNPRNLLTSRIPVLLILQVLQTLRKESAFDVENPSAENTYKNAEPRMLHVMDVALKVTTRNVVRKQVAFQEIILIERISLLPQET